MVQTRQSQSLEKTKPGYAGRVSHDDLANIGRTKFRHVGPEDATAPGSER